MNNISIVNQNEISNNKTIRILHDSKNKYNENRFKNVKCSNLNENAMTVIINNHDDTVKREIKRERNRQAAQRCRKRKLEKIASLYLKVNELKEQNLKIINESNLLQKYIIKLRECVHQHILQYKCDDILKHV